MSFCYAVNNISKVEPPSVFAIPYELECAQSYMMGIVVAVETVRIHLTVWRIRVGEPKEIRSSLDFHCSGRALAYSTLLVTRLHGPHRWAQFVSEQKSILVGRNVHPVIDVTLSVPLGTHYHADVIYFIRVKDESKRQAYTVYEVKPCYADPPFSIREKSFFFFYKF